MIQNQEEYREDLRSYIFGFAAALVLTAAAFALVFFGILPRAITLAAVGALALIQIVFHFRYFLHVDLTRQKREDLQLILFSTLLLVIMAFGTIWIMMNLYGRMMGG